MNSQWITELIRQWLESISVDCANLPQQERLLMAFENGDRLCIEPADELCRISVIHPLPIFRRLKVVENILARTSFHQRGPFRICASMQGESLLILSVFFTREQGGLSQLQQALDHLKKQLLPENFQSQKVLNSHKFGGDNHELSMCHYAYVRQSLDSL